MKDYFIITTYALVDREFFFQVGTIEACQLFNYDCRQDKQN